LFGSDQRISFAEVGQRLARPGKLVPFPSLGRPSADFM
jgi:hypothetical protein